MDNFLDRYQIPKLNQDQINHLNSPITPKEIKEVIKNFPTKKGPGSDGFSAEFYQTFKEDLIPILFKLFHKIETEGTLPNSFHVTTYTLISKPHKGAGEMAQWLRALTALPKVLSSNPSNHMVAHNHP